MRSVRLADCVACCILVAPAPACAQAISIDLPAGPLGASAAVLAGQLQTSIVLDSEASSSIRVPALRGRLAERTAIRRLAAAAGLQAVRISDVGWRLVSRPVPARIVVPTEPEGDPPEIVIIGSKRDASPSAFATVTERLTGIDTATVAGSQAIVLASTAVSSTYRGSGRDKLFIRGIADSAVAAHTQAVTGLYFGDLRLNHSATDPDIQLHDMESVEVLHGPQGTLYGSGSLAGVIRLNPRRPVLDRLEWSAGGGVGWSANGAPSVDIDMMVNVPVDARTALRLVAYGREDGGYIDRPALGRDRNRTRIVGGRANLRRRLGEDWTVDAVAIGQSAFGRDGPGATRGAGDLVNLGLVAEPFTAHFGALHLIAAGRLGQLDLTSSWGRSRQTLWERIDGVDLPMVGGVIDQARRTDLTLHETRISRRGPDDAGWVVGISYTGSNQLFRSRATLGDGELPHRSVNRVADLALFGEGAFRPLEPLLIGAGLRAAHVRSRATFGNENPSTPPSGGEEARAQGWLIPSLSATLSPSDTVRLFARYQHGYRPGALVAAEGNQVFRASPDRLGWTEVGGRIEGALMTAELSASDARWRDIQGDYADGLGTVFTANLGDGRILSLNARASWRPAAGLTLEGAFTINDSHLVPVTAGGGEEQDGTQIDPAAPGSSLVARPTLDRIPYVADLVARIAARFDHDAGRHGRVALSAWLRHEGRSTAVLGAITAGEQGPFDIAGAALSWTRAGRRLSLSVDNMLDRRGVRFLSGPSVDSADRLVAFQRPLTVRFGIDWAM